MFNKISSLFGSSDQQAEAKPRCQYYTSSGGCKFGSSCKFSHADSSGSGGGFVAQTNSTAHNLPPPHNFADTKHHGGQPGNDPSQQACRYFQKGDCKLGDMCRFSHFKGNGNGSPSQGGGGGYPPGALHGHGGQSGDPHSSPHQGAYPPPQGMNGHAMQQPTSLHSPLVSSASAGSFQQRVCKYYLEGNCRFGDACSNLHDSGGKGKMGKQKAGHGKSKEHAHGLTGQGPPPPSKKDMQFYSQPYDAHAGLTPPAPGPKKICSFFQNGSCKFGDKCTNLHQKQPPQQLQQHHQQYHQASVGAPSGPGVQPNQHQQHMQAQHQPNQHHQHQPPASNLQYEQQYLQQQLAPNTAKNGPPQCTFFLSERGCVMGDKCTRSHAVEMPARGSVHAQQQMDHGQRQYHHQSDPPGLPGGQAGQGDYSYQHQQQQFPPYPQATSAPSSGPSSTSPVYYSVHLDSDSHNSIIHDLNIGSLRSLYDFDDSSHLTMLYLADGRPTAQSAQLDLLLGTPCVLQIDGYAVSQDYVVLSVKKSVDERTGSHLPYYGNARQHITLATKNRAARVNAASAFQYGKFYSLDMRLRGLLGVTRYN